MGLWDNGGNALVRANHPSNLPFKRATDVAYVYHVGPHFAWGRPDSADWWREVRAALRAEGFWLDGVDKLTSAIVDSSD